MSTEPDEPNTKGKKKYAFEGCINLRKDIDPEYCIQGELVMHRTVLLQLLLGEIWIKVMEWFHLSRARVQ
jgi:hypothetical protein